MYPLYFCLFLFMLWIHAKSLQKLNAQSSCMAQSEGKNVGFSKIPIKRGQYLSEKYTQFYEEFVHLKKKQTMKHCLANTLFSRKQA